MDGDYGGGGGRSFGGGGGRSYNNAGPVRDEKSGGFRLHVGGIADGVSESEVRETFEKIGAVKDLWLSQNSDNPRFGFVVFDEQSDAQNAIDNVTGQDLGGSSLRVNWAKPREDRGGGGRRGGGGYGGGGYGGGGGGYGGGGYGGGGGGYGGGGGGYGGGGRSGGGGGDRSCYKCGQPGHISRDCTEGGGGGGGGYGGGRSGGGGGGGGPRSCYRCGQAGHISRECPEGDGGGGGGGGGRGRNY